MLLRHLETNDWFGLQTWAPQELVIGLSTEKMYILRTDCPTLHNHLESFYRFYGLSERKKSELLMDEAVDHTVTVGIIREYMDTVMFERNVTPSFTQAVHLLLEAPDLPDLTDPELVVLLSHDMTVEAKHFLLKILDLGKTQNDVPYSKAVIKDRHLPSVGAYPLDTFYGITKCLVNPEYIARHQMIERSLNNALFAEAWMFHVLSCLCAWRASDICDNWVYPRLKTAPADYPDINPATLYNDLLTDALPQSVYTEVCRRSLKAISILEKPPSKTSKFNPAPLHAAVTPEMQPLVGLITLIGESHALHSADGYMRKSRVPTYQHPHTHPLCVRPRPD